MKLSFEGETIEEILISMRRVFLDIHDAAAKAAAPVDKPVDKPVQKPVDKPKSDAAERMAKVRAAKTQKKPEPPKASISPEVMPVEKSLQPEKFEDMVLEPDVTDEPEPEDLDPVQLTALKVKTTEELQAAYAGGKHKQVLALLKTYGNGAKSFRELQIRDFVPIRKAIDEGALT